MILETMGRQIDFLVVGKKSFDNRAVKNILLSRDFDEGDDEVKPEVEGTRFEANKISLRVTNTPGIMDCSDMIGLQMKNNIEYALKFREFQKGFNAVLIVCSYPVRWTPEEERCMNLIRDLIGEKGLRQNAIFVFTDTEALRRDRRRSFDEACRHYISNEMENKSQDSFGHFLKLVDKRSIFLVKDDNDPVNMQQIRKLLVMASQFQRFTLYERSLLPSNMQQQPWYLQLLYLVIVVFRCGVYEWFFPPYKRNNEHTNEQYQEYLKLLPEERPRQHGEVRHALLQESVYESWHSDDNMNNY